MCGIVGQVSFNKSINRNFLTQALKMIEHRGYDNRNFKIFNDVSLGHNLLSITGNKTAQPVSNFEETIFAVVNGEFYDYEEVKKEINKLNYKTDSDSELIIHLYQNGLLQKYLENGKLNGEFSFIIYDTLKNKVIAGRDSFGIKPLYFYRKHENIYLSSEIKGFLPINNLKFDQQSLYSVLSMQYHDTYNTLFEDVKQIQPGSIIIIDINNKTVFESIYFDQKYSEDSSLTFEEAKERLLMELDNSVQRRLNTKKKIGFCLSGGIDSSSILALGSKYVTNKDAYTICFRDSDKFNEFEHAKEMAKKYNFNFNSIQVDEQVLIDNMDRAIYHSEQVSINMHMSSKYLLFKKMAEDGVQVSLSGEGADEILFGYPHFKLDLDINNSIDKNSYLNGIQMPDKDMLDTSMIQKYLGYVPAFMKAKYSIGYKIHKHVISEQFKNHFKEIDPGSHIIRLYDLDKNQNKIFNSSILWSKICLSNYILNALGDKLEMANTIEGRVPFLDRKLFDFLKDLPISYKINNGNEKFILKEAMKPYISNNIYNKQKHPFVSPPLLDWKNNKICYDYIMDILHSKIIFESDYFEQNKILNMIDLIMRKELNPATFDPVIMIILSLYYLEKNFLKGGINEFQNKNI